MQSQEPPKSVFLSYARKDSQFALRLLYDLRAAGADLWIDQLDIKQGEHWDSAIGDALARCPRLLVVLSPAAVKSNNVMDEVSYALTHGKTVLPVICRKCEIPFRLQRVQYEDLSNNYEAGLDRVLARLGVVTPSSEMPEATVLSQTTPHEQKAKPPTLKMRVLIAIAIGIVAYLLLRRVLPPAVFESLERRIPGIIEEILEHLRG